MKQIVCTLFLLLTMQTVLTAQTSDRNTALPAAGWKLWLDQEAVWKNDPLFLPPADISKLPLNPPTCGWDKLYTSGMDASVPGTVEEYCWDTISGKDGGLGNSGNYEGVSWWTRPFNVPASAKGKRVKLYFRGGIRQRAEVFVNERLVGYELAHQLPFEVDITEAVHAGATNRLAVRITDANGNLSWGDYTGVLWGDYYFPLSHGFGGILDRVELRVMNPVHVADVFVKNKPSLHDIDVVLQLANEGKAAAKGSVSIEIAEAWKHNKAVANPKTLYRKEIGNYHLEKGELSQSIDFSASVPQALLWGIKDANLYNMVVTLKDAKGKVADVYTQRFGFRFLAVEGHGSDARYYFNGQRMFILSAISWGFWPTSGMYPTPELARRHIASAQALGMNMVNFHRCMGNSIVLNMADEMGILIYEEPGGYSSSRTKDDNPAVAQAKQFDLATQLCSQRLLRMVKAHRNHPSLAVYNMVNEPGWKPDAQVRHDMAEAHRIDPTRVISYGSGFMNPQEDQPQKLHMLPYDTVQYTKGYVDIHNAGNSMGVYSDVLYNSPSDFWRNTLSKDEIFVWGEEGALASPPQLEKIQQDIRHTGRNGWDGADYKDWYNVYCDYIAKKGLKKYYPSLTGLITSLGDIMYYEHGRLIENARIADGTDIYVLNGYEDMKFDNFSGAVDVFRNLKGHPELVSQYMRPLLVTVKLRNKTGSTGDTNLMDLYVLNEHAIPAGKYRIKAKVTKPDGQTEELYAGAATVSGGDTFSDFVKGEIPVSLDGGKGYYHVTAQLFDSNDREIATGHDEIFAVDWKSGRIAAKGAVLEGSDFLPFTRDSLKADAVAYDPSLGHLDYIVAGTIDNGKPLDMQALLDRVSKEGTTLFLLDNAEAWIKQLQQLHAWPACKFFHPAKTWVGHNYFVREHPFFQDLPVNRGMNWEYQRLVPYDGPQHFGLYDMDGEEAIVSLVGGASHVVSTSVGILPCGKGKIVFSALDLETNLMRNDRASNIPKKIYSNMLKWVKQ